MRDLKKCETSDEDRKMEVLRKMRYDWYIAPYYGSKEQYLFARCQDCNITGRYSEVMNFGEIKNVETRVSTGNGISVQVYVNTDSGEHYCAWSYARCSAFSEAGKKMVNGFDTWIADPDMISFCNKDYPEENIEFREAADGNFFDVDTDAVEVIKDVKIHRNGREVSFSMEKRCSDGHMELIIRYGRETQLYRFLAKDRELIVISGFSDRFLNCVKNSGRNRLLVDSGFHYSCSIEPGEEKEIDPKNSIYRNQDYAFRNINQELVVRNH